MYRIVLTRHTLYEKYCKNTKQIFLLFRHTDFCEYEHNSFIDAIKQFGRFYNPIDSLPCKVNEYYHSVALYRTDKKREVRDIDNYFYKKQGGNIC
jgi:hypothetical protein